LTGAIPQKLRRVKIARRAPAASSSCSPGIRTPGAAGANSIWRGGGPIEAIAAIGRLDRTFPDEFCSAYLRIVSMIASAARLLRGRLAIVADRWCDHPERAGGTGGEDARTTAMLFGVPPVHRVLTCTRGRRKHRGSDQSRRQDLQHRHSPSPFKRREQLLCPMSEVRIGAGDPNARLAHSPSIRCERRLIRLADHGGWKRSRMHAGSNQGRPFANPRL